MKKKLIGGVIVLVLVMSMLSMSGCKLIQGEYYIEYITCLASRNLASNLSFFYIQASVVSTNQVSGKIIDWYVKIYNEADEEILSISMDDYEAMGLNLQVTRTPIQGYYSGTFSMVTDPAYPGDMYNGETPAKALVRLYLQDMNDYQTEVAFGGTIAFEEITE